MPRNEKENEKIRKQREAKILKAALKIFALKGFDQVSIDDIANESRCSHGLIYHYYKSKQEILNELSLKCPAIYPTFDRDLVGFEYLKEIVSFWINNMKEDDETVYYFRIFVFQDINNYDQKINQNLLKQRVLKKLGKIIIEGQDRSEISVGNFIELGRSLLTILNGYYLERLSKTSDTFVLPDVDLIMQLVEKKTTFIV